VWKRNGLKPHRQSSFKLSRDPRFEDKLLDVVGLYLNPPERALVLSCDEKSQIQALNRTQPGLPMKKGRAGTVTHDYKRHGTTTLFAALNTLDGTVISMCQQQHRHAEWLQFLRLIQRKTPKHLQLHLIVDNYGTHTHPDVQAWLARHPRFVMHFTPTSASWLNMVERFFRDISENGEPHPARQLHQRARTGTGDRSVRGPPPRQPQALHLDGQRNRHPGQGHASQGRAGTEHKISTYLSGALH
jgi:transposase